MPRDGRRPPRGFRPRSTAERRARRCGHHRRSRPGRIGGGTPRRPGGRRGRRAARGRRRRVHGRRGATRPARRAPPRAPSRDWWRRPPGRLGRLGRRDDKRRASRRPTPVSPGGDRPTGCRHPRGAASFAAVPSHGTPWAVSPVASPSAPRPPPDRNGRPRTCPAASRARLGGRVDWRPGQAARRDEGVPPGRDRCPRWSRLPHTPGRSGPDTRAGREGRATMGKARGVVVGCVLVIDAVAGVVDLELVEVVVLPAYCRLDGPMELGEAEGARHLDPAPDGRPDAIEGDLEPVHGGGPGARRHGRTVEPPGDAPMAGGFLVGSSPHGSLASSTPAVSSVRLERPNLGQVRRRDAPPFQQVRNVVGAFTIAAPLPWGPLLLVDDVWDSGWVTTVIG